MATHHSDLFLDGDTAARDDRSSVIVITGVPGVIDRPEKGRGTPGRGCTGWPSACTLRTTRLNGL